MKRKKIISFLMLVTLLLLNNTVAFSQCAMCKASVESDLKNGGSIGTGLNTGILYLMAIPYVILITGAYFFFKKPIDAKIKAWKEKRFPSKQVN
jgi:high-affinity nickel permease